MARNLAALVIGNSAYVHVPMLPNPINDVDDVTAKLGELGFSVQKLTNATSQQMEEAVLQFRSTLETSSVGLVFFAGHAFQIFGKNYLAGIDTKVDDELRVKYSALDLDMVLDAMKAAAAPTGFVILDACRNNPFAGRTRSTASAELATVYAPKGTLVAFSTSPGQTSLDGAGRNGYYTQALLQHIATPNLAIETMFKRVRSTLESLTGGRQTSWEHTSLTGDFHFQISTPAGAHGYGSMATADGLFPRNGRPSGKLIEALKTYNWYKQNDGLDAFTTEQARGCTTDELFVIGRNIYQAACGGSNSAASYVSEFMERTGTLEPGHRKALLDGILYEIFFDSEGQHRAKPKMGDFERVFELQDEPELAGSFEFIRDRLTPYADRYFVLPGSGDGATVSVAADEPGADGKRTLNAIWLDGTNILHHGTNDSGDTIFGPGGARQFLLREFREFLAEEMVIPERLLVVDTQFAYTSGTKLVLSPNSFIGRSSS